MATGFRDIFARIWGWRRYQISTEAEEPAAAATPPGPTIAVDATALTRAANATAHTIAEDATARTRFVQN